MKFRYGNIVFNKVDPFFRNVPATVVNHTIMTYEYDEKHSRIQEHTYMIRYDSETAKWVRESELSSTMG